MPTELAETYACVPSTERGRGILISGHPKTNTILYCNGRSVIIFNLGNPLDVAVYGEHAYQATVARFSPNGEWIASADVSGTAGSGARATSLMVGDDGLNVCLFRWDSGTNVGEFDGHSRRVLSCDFKPTRPFRIATCAEDILVNFYEAI